MSLISDIRRILSEDFKEEYQDLIDVLGPSLNSFMDEVVQTINGSIDYENLSRKYKTFVVKTDSSGNVTQGSDYIIDTDKTIKGMTVLKVTNKTGKYPTSCPFISYTQDKNKIKLNNITGLMPNTEFTLYVEVINN